MISNDLDGGIKFAFQVRGGGHNDDGLQTVQQGLALHDS